MDAFANSSASVGLVLGGSVTLAFTFVYYMLRDVLSFREFTECIPDGFKSMIAPIMILTLAWTLSGVTNLLGAKVFVADMVQHFAQGLQGFLPMVIFVVAAFLAFATGTSWGTFSILIPIVIGVFPSGQIWQFRLHPVWQVLSAVIIVHQFPILPLWHRLAAIVSMLTMWQHSFHM